MELYVFLRLDSLDCQVAVIKNAFSAKTGKKDIIKIDSLAVPNIDVLGYLDSDITVNLIKNGQLFKKYHPELPETVNGVIECKNPRCICATERAIKHIFKLTDAESKVYRCMYCESKAK